MNLKTRKEKFINNLKQDKFKNELANPEYACFSDEQKKEIMDAIKTTRWDLPYIRDIFQNAKVQQNIDCLLYLFKANNSKNRHLQMFSWNLICALLDHLDEEYDFNLAGALLEDFSHSDMEKNFQKIASFGESLLDAEVNPFLEAEEKREYFNSVLHSTDENYEIGEMVRVLYNMCYQASSYFEESPFELDTSFAVVKESYDGFLANRPDLCELLKETYDKFNSGFHYLDYSRWDSDDFASLCNFLNTLNKELLIYMENMAASKEPVMPNINK